MYSTHLPLDKMASISQTISSDAFSLMKSFVFWLDRTSLKFAPNGPIDSNQALVWIMAWHRIDDKPLSEPVLTWFIDVYMRH